MNIVNRKQKVYYNIRNHFDLFTDKELFQRYRFQRNTLLYITDLVADDLPRHTNNRGLPILPVIQVGCFLRYISAGSFQQVIGDTFHMSQPSVNKSIWNVCDAILHHFDGVIVWPNDADVDRNKRHFLNNFRLPNIIGALDGTHIRITEPTENGNAFINRKFYPSINVMGVCDSVGKFIYVSAKWPGSCHDSFILKDSQMWDDFENGIKHGILLGDSAYPSRKWLITPFPHPQNDHEQGFNNAQTKARSIIERTFGRFKRRFAMMHQEVRVNPSRACKFIAAAAMLHNIANTVNDNFIDDDDDDDVEPVPVGHDEDVNNDDNVQSGFEMRRRIVENFF